MINIRKIKEKLTFQKVMMLFFGVVFLLMFVLNYFTPLLADDYSYSFGINDVRIHNFLDVILRQIEHYFTWGGRSVAHTIAQSFLIGPKIIFDVFNSLVFCLLIYFIYQLAKPKNKDSLLVLLSIPLLIWFCTPVFGVNCVWLIGSCNYLWTTVLILGFLLLFQKREGEIENIFGCLLIFFFGILAGWTNENTSFGLIFIIGVCLIMDKVKKKEIPKYKIFGLVGAIVGFLLLILAPGNFVRSTKFKDESFLLWRLINRTISATSGIIQYIFPLLVMVIVLSTIMVYYKKKIRSDIVIYVGAAILSVYAMVLSPIFPERAWFGIVIFLIVAIEKLLFSVLSYHRLYAFLLADILLIFCLLGGNEYIKTVQDIRQLKHEWDFRIQYFKEQKALGNLDVSVPYYYSTDNRKSSGYGAVDISSDPSVWPSPSVAKYYGLHSVRTVLDEKEDSSD